MTLRQIIPFAQEHAGRLVRRAASATSPAPPASRPASHSRPCGTSGWPHLDNTLYPGRCVWCGEEVAA